MELAEKIYGGFLLTEDDKKALLDNFGYFGQGAIDAKAILKEKEQEALKEFKEKFLELIGKI